MPAHPTPRSALLAALALLALVTPASVRAQSGTGLTVDSLGHVGVGTTAPEAALDVHGDLLTRGGAHLSTSGEPLRVGNRDSGAGRLWLGREADYPHWAWVYLKSPFPGLAFDIAREGEGRRGYAGGINWRATHNDGATVDVANLGVLGSMEPGGISTLNRFYIGVGEDPGYQTNHLVLKPDGEGGANVGIGTGSPSARLEVEGDLRVGGDAVIDGEAWAHGQLVTSDGRFKEDLAPLSGEGALGKLGRLRPKTYRYKRDKLGRRLGLPGGMRYGLVAEEVEQVLPELVRERRRVLPAVEASPVAAWDGEGPLPEPVVLEPAREVTYKAVNYAELVPLLVRAVQEQQALLMAQQGEIEALKKTLKRKR